MSTNNNIKEKLNKRIVDNSRYEDKKQFSRSEAEKACQMIFEANNFHLGLAKITLDCIKIDNSNKAQMEAIKLCITIYEDIVQGHGDVDELSKFFAKHRDLKLDTDRLLKIIDRMALLPKLRFEIYYGLEGDNKCHTEEEVAAELDESVEKVKRILSKGRLYVGAQYQHEMVKEDNKDKDLMDRPIEFLDLSIRATRALKRFGYNTIGDIVEASEEEINKVRNLGPRDHDALKNALEKLGLTLKPANFSV